ncbi:Serine/threonine-protein kinase Nek2 [Nymphon striatum]|nr:Serine/threonine-protein kinase Nek2 [Nymphon striatum]
MSQALMECHNRNKKNGENQLRSVLHRNIKPTNVFLDEWNNIKMGDFGFELLIVMEKSSNKLCYLFSPYTPPEQMNSLNYNEKSDVWALGCLIYELCAFTPPFYGSNQADLAMKLRSGNFKRIPSNYSNELQNIISAMLTVEDVLRPTIDLITQHPKLVALNQQKMNKEWETRKFSFINTPNKGKNPSVALKDRLEAVKRREQAVCAKELLLGEKQRDIEKREKKLTLKERLAEERLARAEVYLKQHKTRSKSSTGSSDKTQNSLSSNQDLLKIPCNNYEGFYSMSKLNQNNDEQKRHDIMKHVHFDPRAVVDKENVPKFTEHKFVDTPEKWIDGPKASPNKTVGPSQNFSKFRKSMFWKRM